MLPRQEAKPLGIDRNTVRLAPSPLAPIKEIDEEEYVRNFEALAEDTS